MTCWRYNFSDSSGVEFFNLKGLRHLLCCNLHPHKLHALPMYTVFSGAVSKLGPYSRILPFKLMTVGVPSI